MPSSDNPEKFIRIAKTMSGFAVGSQKTHPWWAMAASVHALAEVAASGQELSEPATVALQIMATVFNERTGDGN